MYRGLRIRVGLAIGEVHEVRQSGDVPLTAEATVLVAVDLAELHRLRLVVSGRTRECLEGDHNALQVVVLVLTGDTARSIHFDDRRLLGVVYELVE